MRKPWDYQLWEGWLAEGASQIVKKISGKGVQRGDFLIPRNKIDKLIANKHLLSAKQKKDILEALQSGSGVVIKPTKTQSGGFLGTLLASIGIPMILSALTGLDFQSLLQKEEGELREWVYIDRHLL